MFQRFLNISLRHSFRNTHSRCVSRTFHNINRVHSNLPVCGVITKRILNSRYFCSEQVDEEPKRVTICYKKSNGEVVKIRGQVGETLHEIVGQDNPNMQGYGVCGGTLSCSTCHIIFEKEDFDKPKQKVTDEELDLLGYAPENCDLSRLSCCIKITEEMDGMIVKVPTYVKDQREELNV